MIRLSSKNIALSSFFLALGILFPFVFHQFGMAGRIFSPMHIPVFLAGIFVGPISGLVVGILSPIVSFLLSGMPPPYAVPLMAIELPLYGVSIGLLTKINKLPLILALIISMLVGRIGFALGLLVFGLFLNLPYGFSGFLKASFILGLPGIVLQLILIPLLVKGVGLASKSSGKNQQPQG